MFFRATVGLRLCTCTAVLIITTEPLSMEEIEEVAIFVQTTETGILTTIGQAVRSTATINLIINSRGITIVVVGLVLEINQANNVGDVEDMTTSFESVIKTRKKEISHRKMIG